MEPTRPTKRTYHEIDAPEDVTSSDRRVSPRITRTDYHRTQGHLFEAVTTQDNARVHMGDVHSSQHTHYHGTPHSHADANELSLLDALAFEQMDFRSATIAPAYAHTCDWLFSALPYQRWRNQDLASEHNGFLWIKGKPGAGKSTLMKHALEHAQVAYGDDKTVFFFFNARGAALGKSVEGMYRCLLHQMVGEVPHLEKKVSNADRNAYRSRGWPVAVLQDLFRQAVLHSCRQTRMSCYIDALDEGEDEDQVRGMVDFFYELAQRAVSDTRPFSVCLASRYYPKISVNSFEELLLEDHGGHDADISDYVHNRLRLGIGHLKQQLASEINLRSRGVFLWVVLVVAILNWENDRGNKHLLLTRLQEIPGGLLQLFQDLRSRDPSDDRFHHAIKWVLHALRPLEPEELYIAILTSTGALKAENIAWIQQTIDTGTVDDFILSSSKGFLEIGFLEKGYGELPSLSGSPVPRRSARRVQFIHETVREYFLSAPEFCNQPTSVYAQAHPSATSNQYVKELLPGAGKNTSQDLIASQPQMLRDRPVKDPNSYEGLPYKIRRRERQPHLDTGNHGPDDWARGPKSAELSLPKDRHGVLGQLDLKSVEDVAAFSHVRLFQVCQTYIHIFHASELIVGLQPRPSDVLAAMHGASLFLRYSLEMALKHADVASKHGLQISNLARDFALDKWVLCNTILNRRRSNDHYRRIHTWLQFIVSREHVHLVRDELSSIDREARHSPLGKPKPRSLLDACAKGLGSALHIAASRNHSTEILKLLLESGANVNNMCEDVGGPLHSAITRRATQSWDWDDQQCDGDAASILLEHGANATAKDDRGNSPLHYAILSRHSNHIQLLVRYGADLNRRVGVHGNAAQTAGQLDDWTFMRELSKLGAYVNANDFSPRGPYQNPGSAATDWAQTGWPGKTGYFYQGGF